MKNRLLKHNLIWLFVVLLSFSTLPVECFAQFGSFGAGTAPKVETSASWKIKAGSKTEGVVTVRATVEEGFHIYSVSQKKGGPLPTKITVVTPESGVTLGQFTPDQEAEIHHYEVYGDLDVEEHKGTVVWTASVTLDAPAEDPAALVLKLKVSSLACTNDLGTCVPQRAEVVAAFKGELEQADPEEQPKHEPADEPGNTGLGNSPFDLGGGFESPGLGGGFEPPGVGNGDQKIDGEARFYVDPETGQGIVRVTVNVVDGFHIYSLTQARGGPLPTTLKVTGEGIQVSGMVVADVEPEIHHYEVYGELDVEEVKGTVNWDIPILAPPGDPTQLEIKVIVDALACTDDLGICVPQKITTVATLAADLSAALAKQPSPESVDSQEPESDSAQATDESELPLLVVLGFSLLGGFILNFMPCVLPVIGLKIMSFVNQAGESRRRILALNVWYSMGLMTVFLVFATLAIFLGLGWGQQNQYDSFNIVMVAVIFVMGLSFIGVWEIPIPGFVGTSDLAKSAEKEGPAAAFIKGVVTTLLAIPCSGPGLGVALTYCAKQMAQNGGTQGAINVYLVFIALGVGMAFPYIVIGAFPGLVRFLPKPGSWMETFKELMGYVLLATIVFILTYVATPLVVPTVGFLFVLWAACWWYGRIPFTASDKEKLMNRFGAVVFAGLMGWFCFGVFADEMTERFEEDIEKRILETAVAGDDAQFEIKEGEKNLYTASRLEKLLKEDKRLVMVDFTADWCLTCKTLEKAVLNTDTVQSTLNDKKIVQLVADWSDMDSKTGLEIDKELERLGQGKQLPIIAFYSPGEDAEPQTLVAVYTANDIKEIVEQLDPPSPVGLRRASE